MPSQKTNNLASAALRGTVWTYIAFFSSKLVVFITTIILARYLSKSEFGVVAYAVTIIGFLDVIKDLGIAASLIYYDDEEAIPTAFWLSIITNTTVFILAWIGAPLVGEFFKDPRAIWVTRILAMNFPLSALGSIHETILVKNLAFNRKFIPDFSRAMSKGAVSIGLAIAGFGPWSLILGQLAGTMVSDVILWSMVPWRPVLTFSSRIARLLLRFGIPLVGMNIISVFVLNVDYLLVGRYLGAESLGVYTLAFRVPELTILQLCNIVAQVMFPVYAKIKDDAKALSEGFLQTAQYVALLTVPAGIGLVLLAEPFVLTFLGEKWIEVIPVMRAISIYSVVISLGYNAGDVYKAQGRPEILTKIAVLHAIMLVPALIWVITIFDSIVMVGWTQVVVAFMITSVYLIVALKILNLSPVGLFNVLKTPFVPTLGMSLSVISVLLIFPNIYPALQLVLGILVGALTYTLILWLVSRRVVDDAIQIIQTLLNGRFVKAEV
jgi:PST family polysaccharide transporter